LSISTVSYAIAVEDLAAQILLIC